jgi:tetratricopeptide (TPR) repeat protein
MNDTIQQPKPTATWRERFVRRVQEHPLAYGAAAVAGLLLVIVWGCTGGAESRPPSQVIGRRENMRAVKVTLDFVTDSLDRLHEFSPEQFNDRLVEHLNIWLRQQDTAETWQLDPFVRTSVLEKMPAREKAIFDALGELQFSPEDGWFIQQAAWMRGISNSVNRSGSDPVTLAADLFDWTMRNVQLEDDRQVEKADQRLPKLDSWRSLLWGSAKSHTRAWIFMLLARQQGLDVVMLAYPDPDADPPTDEWGRPAHKLWLPALLYNNELYLFDHRLGMPIPGPDGAKVATLSQVYEDPDLLAQLDVEGESYDVPLRSSSDRPSGLIALIEATPQFLSRSMRELQTHLTGAASLTLSVDANTLKTRLQQTPRVAQIEVWKWPYECLEESARINPDFPPYKLRMATLQLEGLKEQGKNDDEILSEDQKDIAAQKDPLVTLLNEIKRPKNLVNNYLWRGRMLQFQGRTDGENGAARLYQSGRMNDARIQSLLEGLQIRALGCDYALELLAGRPQNPTNLRYAEELPLLKSQLLARKDNFYSMGDMSRGVLPGERVIRDWSSLHATSWLGVMAYERGDFDTAIAYFDKHIVQAKQLQSEVLPEEREDPFSKGALYNLARSYEARGAQREQQAQKEEAEAAERAAQGNEIRAARHRQQAKERWQQAYASYEQAVRLYEEKILYDQRHGALLRARRLIERLKEMEQAGHGGEQADKPANGPMSQSSD